MDFVLGLSSFFLLFFEVGNDWKVMEYMVVLYGEIFFRINFNINYSYCLSMENCLNLVKKECN